MSHPGLCPVPLLAAVMALVAAARAPAQGTFAPFDASAFEAHLRAHGAAAAAVEGFRAAAAQGSVGPAADQALRQLYPQYDRAVAAAEASEPRAALELTKLLAQEDPYLRAHSRYHLGRVFLDADEPELAVEVFGEYLRRDRNRSPLDAEVVYFYGHALASIPEPARAIEALRRYLELFPDAPERFVASATQQIAELEGHRGALHGIADIMKSCERRIRKADTGKETQQRQQHVIGQLEQILEQMIEQESQSSGAPSGIGQPSGPASKSAAPPGPSRIGNLGSAGGIADRWGNMRERDREAIETDLQTKLPGHHRRMLEEYYRRLNAGGR